MGDGTKQNPFTSADVHMQITQNGHVKGGSLKGPSPFLNHSPSPLKEREIQGVR
jgi:hypothetical protein